MKKILPILFVLLFCFACTSKKEPHEITEDPNNFVPFVERIDAALDGIIAKDTQVEIIAQGFDWTEGPLWIDSIGLIFSDIPPNKIYRWTESEGVKTYLSPSGYTGSLPRSGEMGSNGLLLDAQGKLILCQHGDRRIASMNAPVGSPKPDFITLIDAYQGKKLNSPNDATFSKASVLYFTDPPYGLEKLMDDTLKELDFQGVYRYTASDGITLLTDKMSRPNGIVLSPDEKTLYVANSDPEYAVWMKYAVNPDGTIQNGEVFFDATSYAAAEKGLPDGLKVDTNGNIFASGPGGIWIFNDSGEVLGKIKTGQATSNCAIGNGGKVLYITADMYVMRVGLN